MEKEKTILCNEQLTIAIDSCGAELKSLVANGTGIEYLWQADPAFWARSAPILFPIVGMLKDNRYDLDGVSFNLPQHGFARDMEFELVESDEKSASFDLCENQNTKRNYPYCFILKATFTLDGNRLVVSYKVTNADETTMFFSIGSHPAFNVPFDGGELEDYYIQFDQQEEVDAGLPEDGLRSNKRVDPFIDGSIILLNRELFNQGAFIFSGFKSKMVSIKSKYSKKQVVVDLGGAPYLGIWSKPDGAPFVCIEPWFGVADAAGTNGDFRSKEGIIALFPGKAFDLQYVIQISL